MALSGQQDSLGDERRDRLPHHPGTPLPFPRQQRSAIKRGNVLISFADQDDNERRSRLTSGGRAFIAGLM
jgi:hypothetical protein